MSLLLCKGSVSGTKMKSLLRMCSLCLKTYTFITPATVSNRVLHHWSNSYVANFPHQQRRRTVATLVQKRSHYEVLGVTRSASAQEIREAFLKLSKQCHPDTNTNDPTMHRKFVQVNEAYTVLSRPLSRRDYDSTLDADRYMQRHMNNSASAYRSHGYGYSAEAGAHYHYKGHMYDETDWSRQYHKEGENLKNLANFYVLTLCVTFGVVALILQYMYNFVPNPKLNKLRRMTNAEIENHELIMTSEHEGDTVFYYAVKNKDDPKGFNVVAVSKKRVSGDSDEHEVQELTNISMEPSGSSKPGC
ncbi:dnaJ homolog subfamily C member 4 [Aplysia californica]|uniref:DnaJ homolog subfamily C member 4 n=1 Tax=Aplysia californica TaxID=6500 RepID=A0ABM1ACS9_APLCA|nr:dnaJ homolog subfamily C member 4 [Aplysia californica]